MKIRKVDVSKGEFKPLGVEITFETEEELRTIIHLTTLDMSIPDLISDINQREIVRRFLNDLKDKIL